MVLVKDSYFRPAGLQIKDTSTEEYIVANLIKCQTSIFGSPSVDLEQIIK